MGEIAKRAGGGFEINGEVAACRVWAGSGIQAGDFVEFVKEEAAEVVYNSEPIVVQLTKSKAMVVYGSGNTQAGTHLYARLLMCGDNAITMTAEVKLSAAVRSGWYVYAAALTESRVLVLHRNENRMAAMVCTVDGTTITAGTDNIFADRSYFDSDFMVNRLSDNRAFVLRKTVKYYSESDNDYNLAGFLCDINGAAVTAGGETQILSTQYDFLSEIDLSCPSETNVLMMYTRQKGTAPRTHHCTACVVSGTTISVKSTEQLLSYSGTESSFNCIAAISPGVALAAYCDRALAGVYGRLIRFDGATLTAEAAVRLSDAVSGSANILMAPAAKAVIILRGDGQRLSAVSCGVNDPTVFSTGQYVSERNDAVDLYTKGGMLNPDGNAVCIYKDASQYANATILFCGIHPVKNYEATIHGVAKTRGGETEIIQVYLPKRT